MYCISVSSIHVLVVYFLCTNSEQFGLYSKCVYYLVQQVGVCQLYSAFPEDPKVKCKVNNVVVF